MTNLDTVNARRLKLALRAAAWYTAAYRRLTMAEYALSYVDDYRGQLWAREAAELGEAHDVRSAIATRYARLASR